MMKEDPDFAKDVILVFNNQDIPDANEFTPKVLEDTYINVMIALSWDGDGQEFAGVTKRLRDANGIPIGIAHDTPLLDTRIYEVEYLDGHKASLAANTIAEHIFAQKDGSYTWEAMKDVKDSTLSNLP
eukprot:10453853-Ditylum_brightwellii.AAC.1